MRGTRLIFVALGSVACGLAAAGLSLRLADRTAAGSAVALAASVLMVTLGFAMIGRQKPAIVFVVVGVGGSFFAVISCGAIAQVASAKGLTPGLSAVAVVTTLVSIIWMWQQLIRALQ